MSHFCGKIGSFRIRGKRSCFFWTISTNCATKPEFPARSTASINHCPSPANIEITFTSENKTFSTKTDKKGFYQIYDLPAGTYLIEAKLPRGWKAEDDEYYLMSEQFIRDPLRSMKNSKKPLVNQFYFHLSNNKVMSSSIFSQFPTIRFAEKFFRLSASRCRMFAFRLSLPIRRKKNTSLQTARMKKANL